MTRNKKDLRFVRKKVIHQAGLVMPKFIGSHNKRLRLRKALFAVLYE